jgi:hypothetical protein
VQEAHHPTAIYWPLGMGPVLYWIQDSNYVVLCQTLDREVSHVDGLDTQGEALAFSSVGDVTYFVYQNRYFVFRWSYFILPYSHYRSRNSDNQAVFGSWHNVSSEAKPPNEHDSHSFTTFLLRSRRRWQLLNDNRRRLNVMYMVPFSILSYIVRSVFWKTKRDEQQRNQSLGHSCRIRLQCFYFPPG